jgi:tRNA pseudouridine38-40 synthase
MLTFNLGVDRSCDSRKYTYFFPTYLLIPPKPGSGLYETFRRQAIPSSDGSPSACVFPDSFHDFWVDSSPDSSKEDDLQRKRRFRTSPEAVRRLREIAKKFEGTRNFHNFTVGREFSDRSTQRHMKKIEVSRWLKRFGQIS